MMIESNKIEFKSKYTDQIIKEIVSFLNADGGKIYIGVNDDGSVCGAQKIDEILRNISDVVTTQIEPSAIEDVKPELEFLEGLPVVVINVKKGITIGAISLGKALNGSCTTNNQFLKLFSFV